MSEDYSYGDLARRAGDTVEERAEQYGPPEENLEHVAEMWSAYLGVELTGWDYAAMMMLAKLARGKDGTLDEDTARDIAGYADAGWATVENKSESDGRTYCPKCSVVCDVVVDDRGHAICQGCQRRIYNWR